MCLAHWTGSKVSSPATVSPCVHFASDLVCSLFNILFLDSSNPHKRRKRSLRDKKETLALRSPRPKASPAESFIAMEVIMNQL